MIILSQGSRGRASISTTVDSLQLRAFHLEDYLCPATITPADLTPEQKALYGDMRKEIAGNFNALKAVRYDGALMGPRTRAAIARHRRRGVDDRFGSILLKKVFRGVSVSSTGWCGCVVSRQRLKLAPTSQAMTFAMRQWAITK